MTANLPGQEPKKEDSFKEKVDQTLDSLKKNDKLAGLLDYFKSNTLDTLAYIFLIIGIILLITQGFVGELIVGFISGLYFSRELEFLLKNLSHLIDEQGMVRSIILGVTVIAFFILGPGIFIGAAVALLVRYIIQSTTAAS